MTEEMALLNRSSWITPSGDIVKVSHENHDYELPKPYRKIETAERSCVRVSCAWGYDAPISCINIPKRPTRDQAIVLIKLEEAVGIRGCLEFLFSDLRSWNDIILLAGGENQ